MVTGVRNGSLRIGLVRVRMEDITLLELFPIVVATLVFGDRLKNRNIRFHCDNTAVVSVLLHKSQRMC